MAERQHGTLLQSELEKAKAQLEQLQIELCNVVLSRDKALNECASLRLKQDGQRGTIDALNSQMERLVQYAGALFPSGEGPTW